jgi:hypothetical protein
MPNLFLQNVVSFSLAMLNVTMLTVIMQICH